MSKSLHEYSTRELLNEVFKRNAIRQFTYKKLVDKVLIESTSKQHIEEILNNMIFDSLCGNAENLSDFGVFNSAKKENLEENAIEYSCDFFVCKHPLNLKIENG